MVVPGDMSGTIYPKKAPKTPKHELPGYDAVGGGSIGFQNPDPKSVNLRYKRYSLCTLLVLETFRINFWNNSSEKSSDLFYFN